MNVGQKQTNQTRRNVMQKEINNVDKEYARKRGYKNENTK
jgi:hypothetical protein